MPSLLPASVAFHAGIQAQLDELEGAGLLRAPRVITGPQGPEVEIDGRRVICLCSNNYLGLADDPRIAAAAHEALHHEGVGAGASRLISGSMESHRSLETRAAALVEAEAALFFSTGYAANLGTIQALAGPEDLVLSDALNHASLIDGCRLSRARVEVFRHRDVDHAAHILREHRAHARSALIVTDALFSMDGDRAPLRELRALADEHAAGLVVDEAHALGVLGPHGRGACAEAGVRADALVGTLGKALGVSGAFVAGARALIRLVENRARSYVFSTAPSPAIAAAASAAIDAAFAADDRRARLVSHARRLRDGLRALGFETPAGDSPIIPLHVGEPRETMELSARLLQAGVFIHGIRPPTVPPGTSRLRITPMATHTDEHIDRALAAFAALRRAR